MELKTESKPVNQAAASPDHNGQPPLVCRGVRGAAIVPENSSEAILATTRELLNSLIEANDIEPADVASAIFTVTHDLDATYPALAARQLGWLQVPLLCGLEIPVPDGMSHCLRILIHWNSRKEAQEIVHVYLGDAINLRPDRIQLPPIQ